MEPQTAFLLFLAFLALAVLASRLRPAPRAADAAITAAVNQALTREFSLVPVQIDVKTFDGVVILGGFTREYAQLERAVEIARATPGVKSVESRMTVVASG